MHTDKYICIHGHFYQPPRENPWLEEIEIEESAYPFHDWNERITNECYAPNAASRILGPERRIITIVNNYSKISFNFGPTLLSWLENHNPEVYQAILEADKESCTAFSGHGSAIAQVYNHLIMPLANQRDKKTEIVWGIKDFVYRFDRMPEGMWLSETAVDHETLDLLAEHGIKFTILGPHQAKRIRKIGQDAWTEITKETLDITKPYLCILPSGRRIAIFFYDAAISGEVAFGNLLDNGDRFCKRLIDAFSKEIGTPQLLSLATDGETYGHHHRFADMALAYAIHEIETKELAKITIYGEYLEMFPPKDEVAIAENTSWSCVHGVKRWEDDCGCRAQYACLISDTTVCYPASYIAGNVQENIKPWNQKWRRPLREAISWLINELAVLYEREMEFLFQDPWQVRDAYGELVISRSEERIDQFFASYAKRTASPKEVTSCLQLLEMQKNALFMQTSCGWFFDDLAGIETVQILMYACRAMQLAREVTGIDFEPQFINVLENAVSNLPVLGNGRDIYTKYVKPAIFDINRVAFQFAITSLIEGKPDESPLTQYEIRCQSYEQAETGNLKLAMGHALFRSKSTRKESTLMYIALHMGDHNCIGGVRSYTSADEFERIKKDVLQAFTKSDLPGMILSLDQHFDLQAYSLWHLFPDGKRKVMYNILHEILQDVECMYSQFFRRFFPFFTAMKELNIPSPMALEFPIQYTLNHELITNLNAELIDITKIQQILDDMKRGGLMPGKKDFSFHAAKAISRLIDSLSKMPENVDQIMLVNRLFSVLEPYSLSLDLWDCQNTYYRIGEHICQSMNKRRRMGDRYADDWVREYQRLGDNLGVRCSFN